jgi:glycosyltransferase involved in cell wall biosynthesis
LGHFEWYYNTYKSDVDFLSSGLATPEKAQKLLLRNMTILGGIADADEVVCPTQFQADQFPAKVRGHINVIHEGINTDYYTPPEGQKPRQIGTLNLSAASHVLTYATRGLEAYRGFPQFMRALPLLQRQFPKMHTVIAGEDAIYYGPKPSNGKSWKAEMLRIVTGLDHTRLHFVGTLPKETYRTLLQASDVHLYLTVPFVLSWSLLESMACGCAVVGSDTAPVREVLADGENGWLAPFFDTQGFVEKVAHALTHPEERQQRGAAARALVVERYQQRDCLAAWKALLEG